MKPNLPILFAIIISFVMVFQSIAQSLLDCFPEMDGWKKSEQLQIYKPETLYEYIDGAAELYLSYNFKELRVAEYQNDKNASVIIEVYHHQTADDAFGIYSQERQTKGQFLNIGAQGYIEPPILNFLSNETYVKINSYGWDEKADSILQFFAHRLAENLNGKPPLPVMLNCFPQPGKKQNSEKYIAQSFLGHGFLHAGFIADYVVENKSFQLFIITGSDSSDCREMLDHFFRLCQISPFDLKEDQYILSDPYHGKIPMVWKGKYIWGILNLQDEKSGTQYLQEIAQLINKQNNAKRQ